jgi:hypothetical protein
MQTHTQNSFHQGQVVELLEPEQMTGLAARIMAVRPDKVILHLTLPYTACTGKHLNIIHRRPEQIVHP